MSLVVEETNIPEVKLIIGKRFYDERGFFTETYKENDYLELGIPRFVQDNFSESHKGVIRGLHWQASPYGQGKLVSCLKGSILDVAVDIRKNSPTFGLHAAIKLKENDSQSLWVPEGFAHGFQTLTEDCEMIYFHTAAYNSIAEGALNPLDPALSISWPLPLTELSERDANHLMVAVGFAGVGL
jgi:dTDP-4-dehydrorhamnose 3,5-epimerase